MLLHNGYQSAQGALRRRAGDEQTPAAMQRAATSYPSCSFPPFSMRRLLPCCVTQMAIELQRNRELTRTLYTLRGEAPPNEHGCATCEHAAAHFTALHSHSTLHNFPINSVLIACVQGRSLDDGRAGGRVAGALVGGVCRYVWHRQPLLRTLKAHADRRLFHLVKRALFRR